MNERNVSNYWNGTIQYEIKKTFHKLKIYWQKVSKEITAKAKNRNEGKSTKNTHQYITKTIFLHNNNTGVANEVKR